MTIGSICGPTCGAPLFVHVLGAVLLFGGVATVVVCAFAALRDAAHAVVLRRIAFATTLLVVWPSFIVMRVGAQWVADHEHLSKSKATWISVGLGVADAGVLVLAALTFVAWLATRRPRAGTYLAGLASLYAVALGVAWFYMSAKPGS